VEEIKTENQELSKIEQAKQQADRIEKANQEFKALLDRAESLKISDMLGGRSEAGKPQEKVEETPQDYAKRVMAGKA